MSTSVLNLLLWFPWLNFYSESLFLQLLIVVTFYYFISSTNLFYASFTLFTFILLLGIFLAYYNLEVLTGFLLVIEFTAFFIILLFLLSMNFESYFWVETYYSNSVIAMFFFPLHTESIEKRESFDFMLNIYRFVRHFIFPIEFLSFLFTYKIFKLK